MDTKVQKRDGTLEEFIPEKLIRVLRAAGLEEADATKVAVSITEWVKNSQTPIVTSLQIRDQVAIELKALNKSAHDLYAWYESTKETKAKE